MQLGCSLFVVSRPVPIILVIYRHLRSSNKCRHDNHHSMSVPLERNERYLYVALVLCSLQFVSLCVLFVHRSNTSKLANCRVGCIACDQMIRLGPEIVGFLLQLKIWLLPRA